MFIACAKRLHLRGGHQAGVVVLVAGEGQAEAFHRVGEEADRPVVVDALERLGQRDEIVAGEVGHQARQARRRSVFRSAG